MESAAYKSRETSRAYYMLILKHFDYQIIIKIVLHLLNHVKKKYKIYYVIILILLFGHISFTL